MARIIKDAALETRTARERLKPRGKPHYRIVEEGLHLGYRKPRTGAGKWVLRHYTGRQTYVVETIAPADDLSDPDGIAILSYRQAQAIARQRVGKRGDDVLLPHELLERLRSPLAGERLVAHGATGLVARSSRRARKHEADMMSKKKRWRAVPPALAVIRYGCFLPDLTKFTALQCGATRR